MDVVTTVSLSFAFLATAFLYASVGHAGASGYLTAMALFSLSPVMMRPTALILNILVASIAAFKFCRAGAFSWQILLPFILTSVPFAFIGGALILPGNAYKITLGIILLYAASRMLMTANGSLPQTVRPLPIVLALISGAIIGLLSGLTGTGGGIFLTPLLLFSGWSQPRQASGVSAVFILVNSVAGLLGQSPNLASLSPALPVWLAVVAVGGWVGAEFGSQHWNGTQLRRALAFVMVIAALKLIWT